MEIEIIREAAKELDDALETKDIQQILPFFTDDCEIELLGVMVRGKEGVRRWLTWQFIVNAILHDGTKTKSKQAEVLIYDENYKVNSLRLYFDRLDFADSVVKDPISKFIVRRLIKMSLKGLT